MELTPGPLTRRRLLAGLLSGAVLLATAGCTSPSTPQPPVSRTPSGPDPDTLARAAARRRIAELQRAYAAAAAASPRLATRLTDYEADLAAHQEALGASPASVTPASPSATAPASPSASASASSTSGTRASPTSSAAASPTSGPASAPTPAQLAALAAQVSTDLVGLLGPVSSELARLLAAIAACDASHAALLPGL